MPREIGLVSCVSRKRDDPAKPHALYTSSYFEKMRAYADANHDSWYILSAKYGLLDPDGEPIDPYDETLTEATRDEKRQWATQVFEALREEGLLGDDTTLVFHAGKDYYEDLLPHLKDTPASVEIPTEGLRIGEKQAWYNDRL